MKVIVSGGGTGGHIYPGISIAKEILERQPNSEILFIGSNNALEGKLIPREGFDIKFISVEGFNKKISLKAFSSLINLFRGYFQARKIIKEFNPDIVVVTGGYVCVPVVIYSALKGISILMHEQNIFPSITNKMLSKFVTKIAIAFKNSEKFLPKNKVVYTGNPIRRNIINFNSERGYKVWGFSKNKPILLVVGGSKGAENINKAIVNIIEDLYKNSIQLIFITGENEYDNTIEQLNQMNIDINSIEGIKIFPYIHNMEDALGIADVIVSRSGTTIISEITALGVPAILIPSPYVSNNHQEHNALVLEQMGAAILIKESQLDSGVLKEQLINVFRNNETLKKMGENSKKMATLDAASKIYSIIEDIVYD